MTIALSTALHISFADALSRTRDALAQYGFGVLTAINMKATLKAKLGEDMEDYVILGACNPPLAHRAVNCRPRLRTLNKPLDGLAFGHFGTGSFSLLSINALTATMRLEPDMDRAAISGRSTNPSVGANTPAAIGRAITL